MPESTISLEHKLLHQQTLYQQSLYNSNSSQFELTDVDKLINKVGGQHYYQFRSLIIFNMVSFLASSILMGQGFFFDNQFTCNNYQDPYTCSKYICSISPKERIYKIKTHSSSISFAFPDQLFICQNQNTISILQSLLYFGSVVGLIIIPYISDNWGRTKAIKSSWGLFVFGILCICISDCSIMVGIGQFLCGFGCYPTLTICYSFLNEQNLRSKRQRYCVIIQLFLAIGGCSIAFVFVPSYDWRSIFYTLFSLMLFTYVLLSKLIESPKFLILKCKNQTLNVLNQIAKLNNKQHIQQRQIDQVQISLKLFQRSTVYDLFKYRSLKWATLYVGFIFLASQVIYFGTLLSLLNAGYSKLISQQIVSVSQGLGYIMTEIVITRVTRKKFSIITLGLATIFCFILAMCSNFQQQVNAETLNNIQTVCLIITRFLVCLFLSMFFVYVCEIYPTKIRSIGLGWMSIIGISGGMLTPYAIYYLNKLKINTWIVPGIIGLGGIIGIFFLKQTYGKPMYDEIQEIRIITKLESFKQQINTIQSASILV